MHDGGYEQSLEAREPPQGPDQLQARRRVEARRRLVQEEHLPKKTQQLREDKQKACGSWHLFF
jgi:hypothetical protein